MSLRVRRAGLLGTLTAFALVGGSLIAAPVAATGATPPPGTDAPAERVVMDDFDPEFYAEEAAATPPELAAALEADLGITPAEYYAQADAAATAVDVVDSLQAEGVDVLDSRVDGTELIVNVASEADVVPVEEAGATAEIGEPVDGESEAGADESGARTSAAIDDAAFLRDLVGGQGYYTQTNGYIYYCSLGFNGLDTSSNTAQFVTAGHCVIPNAYYGGTVFDTGQTRPDQDPTQAGQAIGVPIPGSQHLGDYYDTSLYGIDSAWTPKPAVGTWNNNQGSVTSGSSVTVRDYTRAIVGQNVCKSGRTTGWTCGKVLQVDAEASVEGTRINVFVSDLCALGGDSGGSVLSGSYALGLVSLGTFQDTCNEPGARTGLFPIDSAYEDVLDAEPNWELDVDVAKPVSAVFGGGVPLYRGTPVTGTVPGGGKRYTVNLSIDGGGVQQIPVSGNGTWSADITSGLTNGTHSFSLSASFGSGVQKSATVAGTFIVADKPAVDRISGATRFDVAVEVANRGGYAADVPVVYIATGYNYPDALSAGPAAVEQGGPLLLVLSDAVPDVVAAKITALSPQRIVVVGGPNSVNPSVLNTLQSLVPDASVERLSGADRYAASRAVVASAFGETAHAYAATGGNFPDALSAGGAAGSKGEPVVLVNGGAAAADKPTLDLFRNTLKTSSLTVVGGVNSVSDAVKNSLATGIPASVDRVAGADRFAASISLNRSAFASAQTVYLATGYNFPDALAGGVLAGKNDSPLYVVPTDCVPRDVLSDIATLGATNVVLLGGPNSLSAAVANLTACSF